jgi:hypothetical protein
VTPDELAAIRERILDDYLGKVRLMIPDLAALLAEVDRLRAQVAAVEALLRDGVLANGSINSDDLRDALASEGEPR